MQDRARARRSLTTDLPAWPVTDFLTLRSLADVGRTEFEKVLLASAVGDPERGEARDGLLDTLVELAGNQFDAADWFVAERDGEPVGVVLPQVFPDRPDRGTVFYLGVLPERRGQGIGRALHALGLQALADRDIIVYFGTVDPANAAMIAVYRANGCEVYIPRKRS